MSCQVAYAEKLSVQELQQIVDSIPLKPQWQSLEVTDGESVVLWYKRDQWVGDQAEGDTHYIAFSIIKAIVASGHNPHKEWITLHVNAEQRGFTTLSGEPGVLWFGGTHYSFSRDILVWTPR